MGCHALLQRIFPAQGSNLGLLHCRQTLYCLSHQGSTKSTKALFFLLLKDKLLWKRPLGQQIQWWLFAKLLLDLFSPSRGNRMNKSFVCINQLWESTENMVDLWSRFFSGTWTLRQMNSVSKMPSLLCQTFQECQAPCVPLRRRPSANTQTARVTMTSGPFLCCCQDQIKLSERISFVNGCDWFMIFISLPDTQMASEKPSRAKVNLHVWINSSNLMGNNSQSSISSPAWYFPRSPFNASTL